MSKLKRVRRYESTAGIKNNNMDPVIIIGKVSVPNVIQPTINLAKPGVPEFLAYEKFSHEWKWPPEVEDFGNILAQAKFYAEGEIKAEKGCSQNGHQEKPDQTGN